MSRQPLTEAQASVLTLLLSPPSPSPTLSPNQSPKSASSLFGLAGPQLAAAAADLSEPFCLFSQTPTTLPQFPLAPLLCLCNTPTGLNLLSHNHRTTKAPQTQPAKATKQDTRRQTTSLFYGHSLICVFSPSANGRRV